MYSIAHSLAASQIDRYLLERAPRMRLPETQATRPKPVITLCYDLGIPGKEIAARVAGALDFHVIDREVLLAIEKDIQLGDRIVSALDEGRLSALDSWIRGLIAFDQRVVDTKCFHHMVSRVIRGISLLGSAVIIGRGANFVLKGTDAFRVRLIAPLDLCIRSVAAGSEGGQAMTENEARADIEREREGRRNFIRKCFKAEINDPHAYEAVFNLKRLDPDHAACLILDSYRRTAGDS